MEQDYLKKQIDQMARVLGKLLANLMGFKGKGNVSEGIEITSQTLKSELDFDIDDLIAVQPEHLIHFLAKEKNISNPNIEKLAEILFLIADGASNDKKETLYERCLVMYEYVAKADATYSLDREMKIKEIKDALQQEYVIWSHSLSEVVNKLIKNGLEIKSFDEFDYSPYNCFNKTIEVAPGEYSIAHLDNKIPMVYSIVATKKDKD